MMICILQLSQSSWNTCVAVIQHMLLQALPGSRLDTHLLQTWLLQHLHDLSSQQAAITQSEARQQQAEQAAAASAAVRAVQDALLTAHGTISQADVDLASALQQTNDYDRQNSEVSAKSDARQLVAGDSESASTRPAGCHQSAPAVEEEQSASLCETITYAAATASQAANSNASHGSDAAKHAVHAVNHRHYTDIELLRANAPHPAVQGSACKAQPAFEHAGVLECVFAVTKELQGGYASQQIIAQQLEIMSACSSELCHEV